MSCKPIDSDELIATLRLLLEAPLNAPIEIPPLNIDIPSLMGRCRGNAALAEKLLIMFGKRLPQQLDELRGGVQAQDSVLVSQLAHTIKGTSANLSADLLSRLAADLEVLADENDWKTAVTALHALEMSVQSCIDSIMPAVESVRLARS